MPTKADLLHVIGTEYDLRRKLTPEEKECIRLEYVPGIVSYNMLARKYGVSKRLINFIIKPESHKRNLETRQELGGSKIYYDRIKHNVAIKSLRERKSRLRKEGKI